ncbi:MAG: NlpC/P60 family protein [Clostridiales bacterium]|nr:NlpC/P60 family protein [Clostridiales bacterium]
MNIKIQFRSNHFRKWLRRIGCSLLIGSMVCTQTVPAWATSKAEKEKKEAQQKLDEAKKKAEAAEANKNAVSAQVSKLTSDLTALLTDIQFLETDIADKEADIKQAEIDYDAAKKEEEKQYAAMKKRIQYMYEKGDTEYLDIFLQVKSMSDLLNKAEYVESIYSYDRKMLDTYQETKQQVADYKAQLENDKAEMEVMELELQGQRSQLETTIANKKKEVSNFDAQLAQAKKDAADYAKTVEKKNQEIQKAKEEEAATSTSKKTSANDKYTGPAAVKSSGGSAEGRAVADYGLQFVGNPYVYGGTSLTNGADCSGFVQQVYKHFGYSLPRSSSEQRSAGREVSYSEAQPGDLICYAGHVAIYIGNGQIVHASTPSTGIKVGTATYRTILSVRRIV